MQKDGMWWIADEERYVRVFYGEFSESFSIKRRAFKQTTTVLSPICLLLLLRYPFHAA